MAPDGKASDPLDEVLREHISDIGVVGEAQKMLLGPENSLMLRSWHDVPLRRGCIEVWGVPVQQRAWRMDRRTHPEMTRWR